MPNFQKENDSSQVCAVFPLKMHKLKTALALTLFLKLYQLVNSSQNDVNSASDLPMNLLLA